jgi:L-2-hydroxyglutarate oxidase
VNTKKIVIEYDVVVIGAGIIGLAIARALTTTSPKLKVLIIDKEPAVGLHASGRNSGVLHAGFYYSPDSLKAQFCREGNKEMRKLAEKYGVTVNPIGKVVVAKNHEELERMNLLYERGLANQVEIKLLDEALLDKYEPLAVTHKCFLWSPTTAIVDKDGIMQAMLNELKGLKVDFLFNQKFISNSNKQVVTNDYTVKYRHLVNASGSGAIAIAHKLGFGTKFSMIPFLGVYRATAHANLPLSTLVYPIPHPENPFLGTHFTITTDGLVKIGPTAQPIIFSEQYEFIHGWNLEEFLKSTTAMSMYFGNNVTNVSKLIATEFPQLLRHQLVKKSAELVPLAREVSAWKRKPSGIRAQLLELDSKKLEQDFVVEGDADSTHLLNIVSPGWTSSIPFANWIVEKYVAPNL